MPIYDEPGRRRSGFRRAPGTRRSRRADPRRLGAGRPATPRGSDPRPSRWPLGGGQACAAGAQAALAAGQEVTARTSEPLLGSLIRDVAGLPAAGGGLQGHHPAAGRPRRLPAVVAVVAEPRVGTPRARSSSTRSSAWRPAASSWRRRWRSRSVPGFVPVRKAGKLPGRDVRASPTPWSTARPPSRCTRTPSSRGRAGAAGRRRARHRRHRRRDPGAGRAVRRPRGRPCRC